jgi:gamma-glutamyltranspeptidase/glutathione hydrolase
MTASRLAAILSVLLLLAGPVAAGDPSSAVEARHGIVVSAQHEASDAGLAILQAGGNAVDAAVAVGYALAVVDPCCGNIGGGGFMLIRRADGRAIVLDFRETAPAAARRDMYLDADGKPDRDRSLYGYLAAGVPGTVMGLDKALTEHGRLDRAKVMAPAIALARDGFVLDESDATILAGKASRLAANPDSAKVFLRPDGNTWQAGDRLVQADLARTLHRIAEKGPDAFYRGPIAEAVAAAAAANGGIMTAADFAAYTVPERAPIACSYRGYRVLSAPPPSSGGTILCEMLNLISGWDLAALPPRSPRVLHLMAEAMRRAYRDRNTELGDPAFVTNPTERLLSPGYADLLRAAIEPARATPSAALPGLVLVREKAETTHYSVVDADGNAVAVTYTLNGNFGAAVMAPGTGFLLNDEMDDFATAPGAPNLFGLVQGEANAVAPGKRPLSSMTPTIIEKDGKPVLVLGSPGGPRITTAVLETLTGIIDHGLSPADAVAARRFHHQWLPDTLYYERGGLDRETIAALTGMGHRLAEQAPWGAVELIAIGADGVRTGVNDPRRPAGAAKGY